MAWHNNRSALIFARGYFQRREIPLTLLFQELLTIIVRVRADRLEKVNANIFREEVVRLLASIEQQMRERGFGENDSKLAIFAVVALLDESVLNSEHPAFSSWPKQPLQEELYGVHVAGEVFFDSLEKLLRREDSEQLIEILEIYYLCLLLGFSGQYGLARPGGQRSIADRVQRRLLSLQEALYEPASDQLMPAAEGPMGAPEGRRRFLVWLSAASVFASIVIYALFWALLHSKAGELEEMAGTLVGSVIQ